MAFVPKILASAPLASSDKHTETQKIIGSQPNLYVLPVKSGAILNNQRSLLPFKLNHARSNPRWTAHGNNPAIQSRLFGSTHSKVILKSMRNPVISSETSHQSVNAAKTNMRILTSCQSIDKTPEVDLEHQASKKVQNKFMKMATQSNPREVK